MSFNGSGTFVINSAGQPVVTGTVISSTAFNALTADLATGLSTTMTKDGQTTATANIPMGTFKFTGLGVGSAATDSATISQVQSSFGSFLTVSGTDTITATVSPSLTAYAAGQMFAFVAANTNTGAVTINISSLGAKSITKNGTTALVSSDLIANYLYVIVYDGTQFQVVGVSATTFTNLTISGVLTLSGAGTQLVSTGTGAWQPPAGTTGQRPATPSAGAMRWNSTLLVFEIYNGISWQIVVSQSYSVNYLAVAGGGAGGGTNTNTGGTGGGGAGGLLTSSITLTAGNAYTITVGAGGAAAANANGGSGSNSIIDGVATAVGGGGGGLTSANGTAGGSGGGGGYNTGTGGAGTSGQGFAGGTGSAGVSPFAGGGGGGASVVGANAASGSAGGAGLSNSLSGSAVNYGGGGGGGATATGGAGGAGGGGAGSSGAGNGTAGSSNTGGGGGGAYTISSAIAGAAGGSGIVIISYAGAQRGTGGTVTSSGGNTIHTFTSSSTYTA